MAEPVQETRYAPVTVGAISHVTVPAVIAATTLPSASTRASSPTGRKTCSSNDCRSTTGSPVGRGSPHGHQYCAQTPKASPYVTTRRAISTRTPGDGLGSPTGVPTSAGTVPQPAAERVGAAAASPAATEAATRRIHNLRKAPDRSREIGACLPRVELGYELPDGVSASEVDAGEVCEQIGDEERLLEPEAGESCAQPWGRVTVVGELDGEAVGLALRSCPDGGAEADEWARLVGLPFAALPGSQ